MSLINCPSCQHKISNKLQTCPQCGLKFAEYSEDDWQRAKTLKYRKYRNQMYRYKMLSFVAIAIAVIGAVPMLWNYMKAIDYGFDAQLTNHWGINLIVLGFLLYVFARFLMLLTKNRHKKS